MQNHIRSDPHVVSRICTNELVVVVCLVACWAFANHKWSMKYHVTTFVNVYISVTKYHPKVELFD